jgi:hypothetical protein
MKLTAVFERVPEGYIGFIEELPGANTQAPTLPSSGTNGRGSAGKLAGSCRACP